VKTDWEAVYRDAYQDVVRFLARKIWDEDRAQELAQETFMRALGHDPDNPRAWVFHVAGNLARDEVRSVVRRKKHLALLKTETEESEPAPTPAVELEARENAERLRSALEGLAERDRDVLLLWDAGLSYAEIAEQTGLAAGAVGTTLARARKRLVEAHESIGGSHAALG
jgi:RNA polymerase sigma factor (sigma-70 family)